MKLNLLPTTVSKAGKAKTAVIGSILIAAMGIAGMVALTLISTNALNAAKAAEAEARPRAQAVVDLAAQADTVIAQGAGIIRNSQLAAEMNKANPQYPNLYDKVLSYMPPFFRVTQISASPTDATNATVNLTGVINSYQDYANLSIALLRIPGVTSVGKAGYVDNLNVVPGLIEVDQEGRPRPAGSQTPIPDNGLDRLAYFESLPRTSGFQNLNGFGVPDAPTKGAGPDASLINVTLTMENTPLQVPNIRAALAAGATPGGAAPAGGAPAGRPGMPPGAPLGAPPGNPGGPPPGASDQGEER